jgi:hypothetical protein
MPKRITQKQYDNIIRLREDGYTYERIAQIIGCCSMTVKRVVNERGGYGKTATGMKNLLRIRNKYLREAVERNRYTIRGLARAVGWMQTEDDRAIRAEVERICGDESYAAGIEQAFSP